MATLQYFKPDGSLFAGDCMPFFHDGVFRLYYLLDESHHAGRGGLGGHQWAQFSTRDLVEWTAHALAVPITEDWEGSICTGSVFFHEGRYHAFYATRLRDRRQHVSLAVGTDGVSFAKAAPNPLLAPPPGYDPLHFRDPVIFRDPETGLFHMLVTALREDHPVAGRGGCLAHAVSRDLSRWDMIDPFFIPGFPDVPECADWFAWDGRYYLVFGNGGTARYRVADRPLGPWRRPAYDLLDGGAARVMKTAAFHGGRRIGVSWIGTRTGDADDGGLQWGGNVVFRELVRLPDGSLGTAFPAELVPRGGPAEVPCPAALTGSAACAPGRVRLDARSGLEAALGAGMPRNFRLTARVSGISGTGTFGLRVRRGSGRAGEAGYDVRFDPAAGAVRLHLQQILRVGEIRRPFTLDLVVLDSIADLCVDGRRCVIDRCPGQAGDGLLFYARDASVVFDGIRVSAL